MNKYIDEENLTAEDFKEVLSSAWKKLKAKKHANGFPFIYVLDGRLIYEYLDYTEDHGPSTATTVQLEQREWKL